MKRFKYIILIALIGALGACSDDFLDRVPKTSMSNELALDNFNNIQLSLNGAYSRLYAAAYYGRGFIVLPEIRGVDAKSSVQLNSGRFQQNFNWAENASNTSALWTTGYYIISAANNILEALEAFSETGVTQAQINQVRGEALFLRALVHWDMVRLFAQPYAHASTLSAPGNLGVPYIFQTEVGEPERNTVAEVYSYVVADLKTAEGLLGTPARGTVNTAFASKEAAQALLAKVYMYMADWQNAANYATTVINSGRFSLLSGADYVASFTQDNPGSEAILLVYGASTQSYYPGFDEIGYIFSPGGYGDVAASNALLDLFEEDDVRLNLFQTTPALESEMWSAKYNGKPAPINVNNIVVLRLSEMHLIRAEALMQGASVSGVTALSDYNSLRTHRGLEEAVAVSLGDIYRERRRELNFEGNGFWDLSRRGLSVERDPSDISGLAPQEVVFPDHRFAFPIPIAEMEANPNMEQNPGYN